MNSAQTYTKFYWRKSPLKKPTGVNVYDFSLPFKTSYNVLDIVVTYDNATGRHTFSDPDIVGIEVTNEWMHTRYEFTYRNGAKRIITLANTYVSSGTYYNPPTYTYQNATYTTSGDWITSVNWITA